MNDKVLDQKLQSQIDALPKELAPSRDLWAGIDHALERRQQSSLPAFGKLSAVAAGFGALALTLWVMMAGQSDPALTPGGQSGHPMQYVMDISSSFEQQKRALLVKYQDNQPAAENWRAQLEELDNAATAIKKALDDDPGNAQLIKMLQQTYQQQLDLIEAVNRSPWQSI